LLYNLQNITTFWVQVPQTSYRGFALGPWWGTSVPQTPWWAPLPQSWIHHCTSLCCETTDMGPVHHMMCPFMPHLCS